MFEGFVVAVPVLGATVAAMTVGIALLRITRIVRRRRLDVLVAEVRPAVLAAIADEGRVPSLDRRRTGVATMVATSLLPKLRGADRDALASILERNGVIADARRGLRSKRAGRRQRCAELLGNAGDVDAVEHLVELVDDRDAAVRTAAARALGRIGTERSVPTLLQAMGERRIAANTVSMAVLRIGQPGASGILSALDSDLPLVRSVAAELAGSLGLTRGRGTIESLLDDDDLSVRVSASRSLGRLSMPGSAEALNRRLERALAAPVAARDDGFLVAMIESIGRIGHRSSIPVLEASFMRRHRVSSAASAALEAMGGRRSMTSNRERSSSSDDLISVIGPVDA